MVKLEIGKRYRFPITVPSDGREKSALFTGEYDKHGNAILKTRNGDTWVVPTENCVIDSNKKRLH